MEITLIELSSKKGAGKFQCLPLDVSGVHSLAWEFGLLEIVGVGC